DGEKSLSAISQRAAGRRIQIQCGNDLCVLLPHGSRDYSDHQQLVLLPHGSGNYSDHQQLVLLPHDSGDYSDHQQLLLLQGGHRTAQTISTMPRVVEQCSRTAWLPHWLWGFPIMMPDYKWSYC